MGLARIEHWATRGLHDFLLARKDRPFEWGTNDCCMFAADAVLEITGEDIASEFRGRYSTPETAKAVIAHVTGGKTVSDAAAHCAKRANLQELSQPLMAQRGDLVLVTDPRTKQTIVGIVHLNGRHVAVVGETGLKALPISTIKRAWKVG